jgi:GAF domain-containing protein
MLQLQTKQETGFFLPADNNEKLVEYASECLSMFSREKEISRGAFFLRDISNGKHVVRLISSYASPEANNEGILLEMGEGLPGQVARDGRTMIITDIPGEYFITSGLGKALPESLIIFPVRSGEKILAVIELASFHRFTGYDEQYFSEISESIADHIISLRSHS